MPLNYPRRASLLLLFICCISFASYGQEGRVVKVIDGDTFDLLIGSRNKQRIRLYGIDSPERGQAFNIKAKEFTASLIAGKNIRIEKRNRDRYGRIVANVYLPDGTYVNAEIIRAGYAWHFKQYSSDAALANCEKEARKAKRGLWKDSSPIAPWDFRKASKLSRARSRQ